MLTPHNTKLAAREIQTGERVSLDWRLDLPTFPSFNRPPFEWRIHHKSPRTVNDDYVNMNTQGSSQWDGFRHYGYQQRKVFYGGRTQEDLHTSDIIGIDKVVETGGITTRAVILDYPRWLQKQSPSSSPSSTSPPQAPNPLSASSISATDLKAMLAATGVQTRPGDLLLLRTGFTAAYERLSTQERKELAEKPVAEFLGVESSREVCEWIWESGFAAVAGDAPSFEMSPLVGKHNEVGGLWRGEGWEAEMQGGEFAKPFQSLKSIPAMKRFFECWRGVGISRCMAC